MKCPNCGKEAKNEISKAGGKKSRRKITPEQQEKMQQAKREKRERAER